MGLFDEISPGELATLSNITALILSNDNSADDNNVLGNFLVAVGSIILTIAAQQQNIKSLNNNDNEKSV